MLVEFSIIPVGAGDSIGVKIAKLISIIEDGNLPYKMNPMGTVIEGKWDEVMNVVRKCHDEVLKHAPRTVTTIKIDDRPGRSNMLSSKICSVESNLGRPVKT